MSSSNENMLDQLEEILEKNKDAEKGYAKAAENVDDLNLKSYFEKKSSERREFNSSLKRELVANFDEIDEDGSFTGTVHRVWMDVKSLFSGDDDEAMLEEAIKGDKAAVEEYDEILDDMTLPHSIVELIEKQRSQIREDLSKVKSLEDLA